MTQVVNEILQGAEIDYGGDPPAPTNCRQFVEQFFDDDTNRRIARTIPFSELVESWDASLAAQRDAVAQTSGERAKRVQELEASVSSLSEEKGVLADTLEEASRRESALVSDLSVALTQRDALAAANDALAAANDEKAARIQALEAEIAARDAEAPE